MIWKILSADSGGNVVGNWAVEVTAVASLMLKLVCKHMAEKFCFVSSS